MPTKLAGDFKDGEGAVKYANTYTDREFAVTPTKFPEEMKTEIKSDRQDFIVYLLQVANMSR